MKKFAELARRHQKGFMIAEATPQGLGTGQGEAAWNFWYQTFFQFISDEKIQVVSYINCDWETIPMFKGQRWKDSRVQGNEFIKKKWLEEIFKDKYLHTSPELYKMLK